MKKEHLFACAYLIKGMEDFMISEKDKYISPLSTRYASPEMQHVFSENF